MNLTIIVPVHELTEPFQQCLNSVMTLNPAPDELIIAIDGGSPELIAFVEQQGVSAVVLHASRGPSSARNAGAAQAQGEVLLFLDSDVIASPDIVLRVKHAFEHHSDAAAFIGSYDDEPGDAGFLSQYRNLQHHYVHQTSSEEVSTFWGGCGAIYRSVFRELGGFDESRRWLEDIDLGYRLRSSGYNIMLVKDLQVKHMKRWTPGLMLWTDFFGRALPWTDLLWTHRRLDNQLNIDWCSRASIILLGAALLSLAGSLIHPYALGLIAVCGLIILLLNRHFYTFLWHKRGGWFTLLAIPWHFLYYALSGAAFFLGSFRRLLK